MATIKIGSAMPEWAWFEDAYDQNSLGLTAKTSGEAVYQDDNGAQIVLTGVGFSYSGARITGGIITGVRFLDSHHGTWILLTNGHYDADATTDPLENGVNLYNFMTNLTAGNDSIVGGAKGASLNLGENHGNDRIMSGSGGGFFGGSQGNDIMKGGSGWDTLSYNETRWMADDKHGIVLNAATGTVIDPWGNKDTISGFEEFRGSVYADRMTGSKADESFAGLKGNDTIDGGGGKDELRYQEDAREGGTKGIIANLATGLVKDGFGNTDHVKNIERVIGTAKGDAFIGDSHDNRFRGLAGKDSYDGGKGEDAVVFQYWDNLPGQHGANVDLSKLKSQIADDGFGNVETTKGVEEVLGSQFADRIKLGTGGGAYGDAGNDRVIDGKGMQWMEGGSGADLFIFQSVKTMTTGQNRDHINDFSSSDGDRIDLHSVANMNFRGTAAFSGHAEVRYHVFADYTLVSGDINGDKHADFEIRLDGKIDLTVSDFIL